MTIQSFKQFQDAFVFPGLLAERALLQTVRRHTFMGYVTQTCEVIESRLLNANRTKHDRNGIMLFSYVLYLCGFTSGLHENFDQLLLWVNQQPSAYVDEVVLKEALNR